MFKNLFKTYTRRDYLLHLIAGILIGMFTSIFTSNMISLLIVIMV